MIVLDASILGRVLIPDEARTSEWSLADLHDLSLIAPAHMPLEVTSLIAKAKRGRRLSHDEAHEALDVAHTLLNTVSLDREQRLDEVLTVALRHHIAVYDAAYLELALRRGASLLTGDGPLARAALADEVGLHTL